MTGLALASVSDERTSGYATHEVLNQPGALAGYNAYAADKPLTAALRTFGADWADERLQRTGALVGSERVQHLARQANRHLPELRTHDRFGHRVDVVEFHPAYHELMALIYRRRDAFVRLDATTRAGAHVARAGLSYLWNQGENGICCPIGHDLRRHRRRCGTIRTLLGGVGAVDQPAGLRSAADLRQAEGRRHDRHGDDREAGRLGPARHA